MFHRYIKLFHLPLIRRLGDYGFVILFKRSHNEICVLTDGHHNVEIKHEKLRSGIKRRSKRYSANIHILLFIYIRADIGAIKHIKWPLQI